MTAPNANTYDLSPSRRPGINDFNGSTKIDDANYPPDPSTMPSAGEYNTLTFLTVATNKVLPMLKLSITANGVQPTVYGFVSPVSAVTATPVNGQVFGTFTIVRNSAGDVSITWPAGTFPAFQVNPDASLNSGAAGMVDAVMIANGVRVHTYTGGNVAADLSFTVTLT